MSNLFQTPDEIAQKMLDDYKAITGIQLSLSDLNNEVVIKAKTYAGSLSMQRAKIRQTFDNIFPASSDEPSLELHLAARQLPARAAASQSNGKIKFTGVDGTAIGTGVQVKFDLDGRIYVTIESGSIGDVTTGELELTCQSLLTGQNQNIDALAQPFSLVGSIPGVDAECENTTQFRDGRDKETAAEMLARIQTHDRDDDTGGNIAAYERWAKEASNEVVTATAIKNARGINTVDTVITSGTTDIEAAVNNGESITRLPSNDLINTVQAYILSKNPVTDDHQTIAPTEETFDIEINYELYDETLRGAVDAAIEKLAKIFIYKARSAQVLYPTTLERTIDEQLGHLIVDRRVENLSNSGPTFTVPSNKLLVPGSITLGTL